MKLATAILVLGMATGSAWGQNPDIIENTRNTLHAVQVKQTNDSNAALAAGQGQSANPPAAASTRPAPGTPAVAKSATSSTMAPAAPARNAAPSQAKAMTAAPAVSKSAAKTSAAKTSPAPKAKAKRTKTTAIAVSKPKPVVAVEDNKQPVDSKKPKVISMAAGRRDPFLSPVVSRSMTGSGCSTGKRCLAIDQIALKGIVKSDAGMVAVVVNALDKAYFLRENDPVFNGYVLKITGDSIVFKETVQDKLGKPFTRDVTKKIVTPAV